MSIHPSTPSVLFIESTLSSPRIAFSSLQLQNLVSPYSRRHSIIVVSSSSKSLFQILPTPSCCNTCGRYVYVGMSLADLSPIPQWCHVASCLFLLSRSKSLPCRSTPCSINRDYSTDSVLTLLLQTHDSGPIPLRPLPRPSILRIPGS